jgi:hypothetical protein
VEEFEDGFRFFHDVYASATGLTRARDTFMAEHAVAAAGSARLARRPLVAKPPLLAKSAAARRPGLLKSTARALRGLREALGAPLEAVQRATTAEGWAVSR